MSVETTDLNFVIEDPTNPPEPDPKVRRRLRLVTSCDHCRARKVKCIQLIEGQDCEACKALHIPCVSEDKERYKALRRPTDPNNRMQQAWNINEPAEENHSSNSYVSESLPDYPIVVDDTSEAYPVDYDSLGPTQILHHQALSEGDTSELFDPDNPQYPRQDLMEHLMELYIDRIWSQLPCRNPTYLMEQVKSKTLQPILANGIAALTCRFSNKKEFSRTGPRYLIGEPYLEMAKLLVITDISSRRADVLYGLILIAWTEYGSSRDQGLFMFSRMAMAMLQDLGYKDPKSIRKAEMENRDFLRNAWWSVFRLDLTSSWTSGHLPTFHDSIHIEGLPFTPQDPIEVLPQQVIYGYLTTVFSLQDETMSVLSKKLDDDPSSYMQHFLRVHTRVTDFQRSLPDSMYFNSVNFQAYLDRQQGPLLVLLHVSFHCLKISTNWPTLFRVFTGPVFHNLNVAYESALAIVDIIRIVKDMSPLSFMTNPFFDVSISTASRVLIASPGVFNAAICGCELYDEAKNEEALYMCLDMLKELLRYWAPTVNSKSVMKYRRRNKNSQNQIRPLPTLSSTASKRKITKPSAPSQTPASSSRLSSISELGSTAHSSPSAPLDSHESTSNNRNTGTNGGFILPPTTEMEIPWVPFDAPEEGRLLWGMHSFSTSDAFDLNQDF